LSTGLRINTGKDDPAGLIASENLRSDIVSTEAAVTNSERANQIIATADSALSEVSSLLNDIRGLVTEAANSGALSAEQIAANQLQIDSSLESINRIAQTTTFQGRRLLDGALDFISTAGTVANIASYKIDQANLGTTGTMAVDIDITNGATRGSITATVVTNQAANSASAQINFVSNGANQDYMTVTAATAGAAANDITIDIIETSEVTNGSVIAWYDETNEAISVYVSNAGTTTMAAINTEIHGLAIVNSQYFQNGANDTNYVPGQEAPAQATLAGGADAITGLTGALVFELSGNKGAEVFTFETSTSGATIAAAVNLVSDATGVTAAFATNTLTLTASEYGSDAFVAIDEISDAGAFTPSATRVAGDDIVATVNGVSADGKGNRLSVNTATLDLTVDVTDGSTTDIAFNITGGGALFQLGPDVVSNQQARLGIQSMNAGRLGGVSGRMYQLGSGQSAALATDATTAASIVDEAIDTVTSLRGRLGAFQKTTLESNIITLNDTLVNLTEAESSIRDADFATESANLTRAQILVQSGTSVLAIANTSPQNVLALLR